jgi:hypothetical protein
MANKPTATAMRFHKTIKMELILERRYFPTGTNGKLFLDGQLICSTIELPWRANMRQVSCIPEGKYEIRKRYTARFGYHLMVKDVTGRSNILIHAFNNALEESKGCIAPVSECRGAGQGTFSRASLKKLTAIVYPELENSKPVFLTIKKAS